MTFFARKFSHSVAIFAVFAGPLSPAAALKVSSEYGITPRAEPHVAVSQKSTGTESDTPGLQFSDLPADLEHEISDWGGLGLAQLPKEVADGFATVLSLKFPAASREWNAHVKAARAVAKSPPEYEELLRRLEAYRSSGSEQDDGFEAFDWPLGKSSMPLRLWMQLFPEKAEKLHSLIGDNMVEYEKLLWRLKTDRRNAEQQYCAFESMPGIYAGKLSMPPQMWMQLFPEKAEQLHSLILDNKKFLQRMVYLHEASPDAVVKRTALLVKAFGIMPLADARVRSD